MSLIKIYQFENATRRFERFIDATWNNAHWITTTQSKDKFGKEWISNAGGKLSVISWNIHECAPRLFFRYSSFWIFNKAQLNPLALSNRPFPPPQRKTSLPKHSDVKKQFLEICDTTLSEDVKMALRLPSFDSYDFEDYEVLHLLKTMFVELSFLEKFHISPVRLREWLYEVYKHYNDVPFHNFRHCFCVSQMVSKIWQPLWRIAGLIQARRWNNEKSIKIMIRISASFITSE